jgi:hypothetical protein
MKEPSLLERIYRLKLLALGALLVLGGLVASIGADSLRANSSSHLLTALVQALSDVMVVTGGFGIAVDFFTGRDKDAADTDRTRAVLKELAPDFTDAVLRGFAVQLDDLRRVATPELLDAIATNALALRLGDARFAAEIYADVRDQAIRAPERWYDVEVKIRLSAPADARPKDFPRFDVVVEWEYTVTPSHPFQRFACVSDRDEFHELVSDVPATSTWFMTPRPGFDASQRESFALLEFSVDGEQRLIRRQVHKSGQIYSATIGEEVVQKKRPVRIRHIYKTITPQSGHRLFVEVAQPTRGVSLELDYSGTAISHLSVSDLVSSVRKTQISRMPKQVDAKVLSVDLPGWLLPKAGFTFVWTLGDEESPVPRSVVPATTRSRQSHARRAA